MKKPKTKNKTPENMVNLDCSRTEKVEKLADALSPELLTSFSVLVPMQRYVLMLWNIEIPHGKGRKSPVIPDQGAKRSCD